MEQLYNELGRFKWVGEDDGWNDAISAVRKHLYKKIKEKPVKELPQSHRSFLTDPIDYTKEFQGMMKRASEEASKNPSTCMFDGLDPMKAYGIACTCPKCTVMC